MVVRVEQVAASPLELLADELQQILKRVDVHATALDSRGWAESILAESEKATPDLLRVAERARERTSEVPAILDALEGCFTEALHLVRGARAQ